MCTKTLFFFFKLLAHAMYVAVLLLFLTVALVIHLMSGISLHWAAVLPSAVARLRLYLLYDVTLAEETPVVILVWGDL